MLLDLLLEGLQWGGRLQASTAAARSGTPVVRPGPQGWAALIDAAQVVRPEPQEGLDVFLPPGITLLTLEAPRLRALLRDTGSYAGLAEMLDQGAAAGALRVAGERLLLAGPRRMGEEAPRAFDITALVEEVALELRAGAGTEASQGPADTPSTLLDVLVGRRRADRDAAERRGGEASSREGVDRERVDREQGIEPIVTIPGPSPAAARQRARTMGPSGMSGRFSGPGLSPGETMTLLRMPGRRRAGSSPAPKTSGRSGTVSGREAQVGEGTATPPGSGSRAGESSTATGGPPGWKSATGGQQGGTTNGRQRPGPVQIGGHRAPGEGGGAKSGSTSGKPGGQARARQMPVSMLVESTLQELSRVIRREDREEKEQEHDRVF